MPVVSARLGLNIARYSQLVALNWRELLVETGRNVRKVTVSVLGPLGIGVTQRQTGLLEEGRRRWRKIECLVSVEVTIGQTALSGVSESILVVPDRSAGALAGGQGVCQGAVGQWELLRRTEPTARGRTKALVRTPVAVRVIVMVVELEWLVLQLKKFGG